MGDHVEHGTNEGDLRADEDAQDHEAEVRHGGVGHEAHDVVLAVRGQASPQDGDDSEHAHDPLRGRGRAGGELQAQGDHAEGTDLVQDADEQHRGAGTGDGGRVRQPRVHRDHGGLDSEGNHEGHEDDHLNDERGARQDLGERVNAEERRHILRGARAHRPQVEDATEHHQATEERVQQELHRGLVTRDLVTDAVASDHEVERHEHRLEGEVEDRQIVGCEDHDHECLEGQDERRVGAAVRGIVLVPARNQHERHEADRQQDHDEAQRGDAEGPGDADLGDPQVGLVHLVRGRGGPVEHGGGHVHAERELDEGDHQGDDAPGGAPQGRDEAEEGRARSRNGHEDGQPREVSSNHCTFHCRVPLTA